jgi:branched-chain amino acid aminotransferase
MPALEKVVWLNGNLVFDELASPSIASHSLHYGAGVFDGIMAYWNRQHYYVHLSRAHLHRFLCSCSKMGLQVSWSIESLEIAIRLLLQELRETDYYLRPIAYHARPQIALTGENDKSIADLAILAMASTRDVETPLSCHISPYERVSGRAIPVTWKVCAAYANSYLARRAAEAAGYDDGIMLDRNGKICESSAANLFLIADGALVTPRLNPDIFPGITRSLVIELARNRGIEVIERDIVPEELGNFDGAFLTATLMEIKPLTIISPQHYTTYKQPVFLKILADFRAITHERSDMHGLLASE